MSALYELRTLISIANNKGNKISEIPISDFMILWRKLTIDKIIAGCDKCMMEINRVMKKNN